MIELGQKVRDSVSGLEGIAVAKTQWLNGCIRFVVQPPVDKDGKIPDGTSIDHEQLTVIDDGITVKSKPTGGGERLEPKAF